MPRSSKFATAAYWLLPSLICIWLHRDGIQAWFQADDFAWLGANTEYFNTKSFFQVLFRPAPQGTLRPLSERLFFFAFWHAFGWNALPYRIFIMANQCLNLALVCFLVRRISGSGLAGLLAPILWISNAAVVVPMAWTCGYNEVLCATFLLGALSVLAVAQGRTTLYLLQLGIFVTGFGALELNIIYPAIAAVYCYLYDRKGMLWTAPMFAISVAYYFIHAALVPVQTSGPYEPHYDAAILATLWNYWKLVFAPPAGLLIWTSVIASVLAAVAVAGLAVFLFIEVQRRRFAAGFFTCWFLLTLAPLLPFRDHLTHYYLAIPMIGFAAIAAIAAVRWRTAGLIAAALYFGVQLPALDEAEHWYLERSRQARSLVMGVMQVHRWEPSKTILLADVSSDLYGFTIPNVPFRLIRNARVYLTPESADRISGLPSNIAPAENFVLPTSVARHALLDSQAVVYSAARFPLQEITKSYTSRLSSAPEPAEPRRIDAGSPAMAYLLGPEWYQLEGPYRWMPKHASIRMGGPEKIGQKLYVSGFAVPEALGTSPVFITLTADGVPLGTEQLKPSESTFTKSFSLTPALTGKRQVNIEIAVSRTFQTNPGSRPLGLVFGIFEIR